MYLDNASMNILKVLYEKYKLIRKLEGKIAGGWTFNMERTKEQLSAVEYEVETLELPLYDAVDQMRLKVMQKFINEHPKDKLDRDRAYILYGRLLYDFKSHYQSYIFSIHTSFDNFISKIDKLFDPNLFLKCLEEQKLDKYVEKPISKIFYVVDYSRCPIYERWFTFILDENKEKFHKMLDVFPEKKQEITTRYYCPQQEEYLEPWERDEYDDSYGAWLERGGPYKESSDDPYESALDPFEGGIDW